MPLATKASPKVKIKWDAGLLPDPNPEGNVWERNKFPVADWTVNSSHFPGKNRTMQKPSCWTPGTGFGFGGITFVALYKCIAFETQNAGWVLQRGPHGLTIGRE